MASKGNHNKKTPTKPSDASRAQGAVAKQHGGKVPPGSYVGRLQEAANRNFGKPGEK